MIDTKRLAQTLLGTVRDWVEPAIRSMSDRLDELDARLKSIPAGPQGPAGSDGRDGRDADPQFLRDEIARLVAEIPKPSNGIDGKDGAQGPQGDPGRNGIDGKDGESVHPDTLARIVSEAVNVAVNAMPAPRDGKDGRDIDPAIVERMVNAAVVTALAAIPAPKDGAPGLNGRDADPEFIRAEVAKAFAAMPMPRDGTPGKDGAPGANGRDADPDLVKKMSADAVSEINLEFFDMADELLRGLEDAAVEASLVTMPSMNVNLNVPSAMIAETIRETLMLPVRPVYDSSGKLLYGQRVAKSEEAA